MRNRFFRGLALGLALMLLVGTAVPALAAKKVTLFKTTLWVGYAQQTYLENLPAGKPYKITSVKSSKPAVIKATKYNSPNGDWAYVMLDPKKAGTSKITVTYQVDGGKKKTVSANFTVKNNPKALTLLKINGKKINLTKNQYGCQLKKYKGTDTTVEYTLKKGWVVSKRLSYYDTGKGYLEEVTWKSDTCFTLPKGRDGNLTLVLLDKKTKDTLVYDIRFFR